MATTPPPGPLPPTPAPVREVIGTSTVAAAGVPPTGRPVAAAPDAVYASAGSGSSGQEVPLNAHTIHGSVRGSDGSPVGSATLTLISLQGRQLSRAVAGYDGGYALSAPGPGSYVLIAAADGHQPQAATVVVDGGEGPLGFDVVLAGTSGLAGQVRSAETGDPVAGAMVVVTDVRGEVLATGKSDDSGAFAFAELPAGSFTIAINSDAYQPAALPVEVSGQGITRVEVELRSGARLQGTVRAGADRLPLADARVTLVNAAGNVVGTATTGEDGSYAFTDLAPGDYTLIAGGYPPVATTLDVSGGAGDGHDVVLGHPDE